MKKQPQKQGTLVKLNKSARKPRFICVFIVPVIYNLALNATNQVLLTVFTSMYRYLLSREFYRVYVYSTVIAIWVWYTQKVLCTRYFYIDPNLLNHTLAYKFNQNQTEKCSNQQQVLLQWFLGYYIIPNLSCTLTRKKLAYSVHFCLQSWSRFTASFWQVFRTTKELIIVCQLFFV